MFDVGFSELVLIAVVAMIVIGPERLPKVARTAGALLGRMQRYVANVKSEVEREMQFEDLKKLQQEIQAQSRELENSILAPTASDASPAQSELPLQDQKAAITPQSIIPPKIE
ncbi:Sec-independent protein translocase protein TatB [Candidatus Methylopumilus turicensis]|jgi:sec-independent protein translocase protein TatB|uniref:Sec-independent protein translocase protein TatB n=1 Tax=Candidatus Methylopumilus turicensis TaxID=1581680 RepID=A0A0B7IXN2_9PROT|nr:Sec-independent protein translocase protein TatB [Candidatus Methylopumilus turicensis]CEN55265.1 Sec-independent protein translocase protein TatB [Candidatus Methylopumilus turicensis]